MEATSSCRSARQASCLTIIPFVGAPIAKSAWQWENRHRLPAYSAFGASFGIEE